MPLPFVNQPSYIAAEKKRLRTLALGRRAAMGDEIRAAASREAARHAMAAIGALGEGPVALFAPFRDEIDTFPLADALRDAGADLALPVIVARDAPLLFRRWEQGSPLVPSGSFLIPEPLPDAPEVRPAVVLVPLAAFDRLGYRIGYGAGYYDRTLEELRGRGRVRAIGFAFARQEVDAVPREDHDEPVDMMVTEMGATPCMG